jgi:hypothetical protein
MRLSDCKRKVSELEAALAQHTAAAADHLQQMTTSAGKRKAKRD